MESEDPAQRSALAAAFFAAMDPIQILSPVRDNQGEIVDFRFEDLNPALCEHVGFTRVDLIGHRLTEVYPTFTASLLEAYIRVVETGTPLLMRQTTFPSAVTQEQPRLFDVSAVRAGDGLAVTFRDVTEAVEQAEQLRRSERRFRLLSQNTNDLVLAFENDVIQWASPFTQDLLGYTPEELIGRDWASFSYGDGQDLQALDEMNVGDAKIRARTRIRAKDGSCHWISVAVGPNYDDDGNRIGTLTSLTLADREVAAENEIRDLLNQRDRILEKVPVGVFRISVRDDGRVERDYTNDQAVELLDGWPECPLTLVIVGHDLNQEELGELTASAHEAARSGTAMVCETCQPDGRWVLITARANEGSDGFVTIDGIVEDITLAKARDAELKAEANAAAEQADQLARSLAFKSAVLSAVGHDLRTPLAVLSSSASTLGDATGLSETERAELIDKVQDSARSLEALVVDLLDVQRIDVGAIEVRSEAVRLWEVLEDALRHLPAVAMDIPDDFPAIEADAGLLARVLDNLLRNAALHADSDRPVELSATWDTDHALISVVDHGIGVPEQQFSRLFEPFDRLRDDRPGSGVGLWIAHQFAGAMGMTLDPGETPGGGLTMTVKARLSGAPAAHC